MQHREDEQRDEQPVQESKQPVELAADQQGTQYDDSSAQPCEEAVQRGVRAGGGEDQRAAFHGKRHRNEVRGAHQEGSGADNDVVREEALPGGAGDGGQADVLRDRVQHEPEAEDGAVAKRAFNGEAADAALVVEVVEHKVDDEEEHEYDVAAETQGGRHARGEHGLVEVEDRGDHEAEHGARHDDDDSGDEPLVGVEAHGGASVHVHS